VAHNQSTVVAPYFRDIDQQREANTLGMWAFLATEIMFFGGLFIVYLIYRISYPEAFVEGSLELNLILGTINTFILLGSSFTMAMSIHSAQTDQKRRIVMFLVLTVVLGTIFLVLKALSITKSLITTWYRGHILIGMGGMETRFSFSLDSILPPPDYTPSIW
jgi:cytochrome c oxidase subunit 3